MSFYYDSDAFISKGMVTILCDIYGNREPEEIKNPYSGEKVMLEPEAVAVYDCIKGAEHLADPNNGDDPRWETVRKGLDWFRKHFPKEYMKLLD